MQQWVHISIPMQNSAMHCPNKNDRIAIFSKVRMLVRIDVQHPDTTTTTTTTVLRPFFQDHPGEPVPEENFWTLWCKGRLTEADTHTIRLGTTLSGLTSPNLHYPPYFLRAGCPSCRPTNSVKALKASSTFGLGRKR